MKSLRCLAAALAVLILTMALTGSAANATSDSYYDQLHEYVDLYNGEIEKIPFFVTMLVREQYARITFESTTGPDEIVGAVTGEDGSVLQFLASAPFNPTMVVSVRPGTVERLVAENCGNAVLAAVGDDIRIDGVGIVGRIRTLTLRLLLMVARRFL